MQKLTIQNNSILIVPDNIKMKVLRKIEVQEFTNVKIMTLSEFQKKYYFDYDNKTIFYLMEKYHYQYDVAKMYLSKLLEVEDNSFGSSKIQKIIDLKQELMEQKLLSFCPSFRSYLVGKRIVFYECEPFSNLLKKMVLELKDKCIVESIMEEDHYYHHDTIYQFHTIEEEVVYVASCICELFNQKISFHQIKLCGASGEYLGLIKRIFEWFHIPIVFQDNSLYATKIGQDFLGHLEKDISSTFSYIEEHYSLTNQGYLEIYNQMIQIVNSYVWVDDFRKIKNFLEEDFKNTMIKIDHYEEEVTIIQSLAEADSDDYVFLLGFNQGEIPKIYKDEDYFNDDLKLKLGLETTNEFNQRTYLMWLKAIQNTKNLIITTKESSSLGVHYLSSLNDDLKLEIISPNINYHYSNLYNQLILGEKIDSYIKYGEKEKDLELLYSNYPNIPYGSFQSNYQMIPPEKIKNYLNHQLTLSYSSMNSYYQCGFRYYLSSILKLNIFEETFYTILGNLFHHILAIALEKEVDIEKEYDDYLRICNYSFNAREKFFLERLKKELEFVIQTIKKQNEVNSLKKSYFEEKIVVDKSRDDMNITFKGFVDKIMLNEEENVLAIVDYKTGNPDLNLNHIIYGLDLQLPVYVYLARKKFPEAQVAGFYLQKILNSEISKDFKHTYEDLKIGKLKLQGYSNSDLAVLEKFDASYYESKMIQGMRTTSKGLASKKVLNHEQIDKLEAIALEKIEEVIDHILRANFEINPKRIGMDNLGCKYCQFRDICFMGEDDILDLKEYKNMEFLGGDGSDTEETS